MTKLNQKMGKITFGLTVAITPSGRRLSNPNSFSRYSKLERFSRADCVKSLKQRRISRQQSWTAISGSRTKEGLLR